MHQNEPSVGVKTKRQRSVLSRSAFLLVGGGISVALLFWAKLRVVTNLPRTTYAQPAPDLDEHQGAVEIQDSPEPDAQEPAEPRSE